MREQILTSVVLISTPARQPWSKEGLANLPGTRASTFGCIKRIVPFVGPSPASPQGLALSSGPTERRNQGLLCHAWAGTGESHIRGPEARTRVRLT